MTEEKKPIVDRFHVEKKDFDTFNSLKDLGSPFYKASNKEIFLAAMLTGYHEKCRIPLKTREGYFHEKDLKEDTPLVLAIAIAEENKIEVVLDKQKMYSIAEEYATGGIAFLKEKISSGEYGSYAKKLESELLRSYEAIKETPVTEVYPEDDSLPALEALPVSEIAKKLESKVLEFKSSIYWDYKREIKNEQMKVEVAMELAAFMNSKGGILIIGVDNSNNILGIQKDLDIMHNNKDAFELTFTNLVRDYLGKINGAYTDLRIEKIEDKEVAVIRVKASPHEVYVKIDRNKEEFCYRPGNSCVTLLPSEASVYIKEHWPNR